MQTVFREKSKKNEKSLRPDKPDYDNLTDRGNKVRSAPHTGRHTGNASSPGEQKVELEADAMASS